MLYLKVLKRADSPEQISFSLGAPEKILISRRASSRKTPEMASAAEHGLHKRVTVLSLLIQGLSNNFVSSP